MAGRIDPFEALEEYYVSLDCKSSPRTEIEIPTVAGGTVATLIAWIIIAVGSRWPADYLKSSDRTDMPIAALVSSTQDDQ
ncbi:MAG: hypothetical protein ABL949_08460 [Fimbriimonadaceae bacterium]